MEAYQEIRAQKLCRFECECNMLCRELFATEQQQQQQLRQQQLQLHLCPNKKSLILSHCHSKFFLHLSSFNNIAKFMQHSQLRYAWLVVKFDANLPILEWLIPC